MSAFDCYLPALAGQLGFEQPSTEAKRRNFWTSFSQQLIYRREPDGKLPFHIERWKQVQPSTERVAETQNGKDDGSARENETDDPDPAG